MESGQKEMMLIDPQVSCVAVGAVVFGHLRASSDLLMVVVHFLDLLLMRYCANWIPDHEGL